MQPWKEIHYARVQEFVRQLSESLPEAATRPRPVARPATSEPAKKAASPASPATPAASGRPPGPTASNVFGKIPWKK